MTQCQLNRAVAAATGETVRTIEHLGFLFVRMPSSRRRRVSSQGRRQHKQQPLGRCRKKRSPIAVSFA
jgi:hypothetical protein